MTKGSPKVGRFPQAVHPGTTKAESGAATLPLATGPEADTHSGKQRGPIVLRRLKRAAVSELYDAYWRFAAERQAIFFRRMLLLPRPWTINPVLRNYKFTNAYRASDRVTQYLIRNVIYRGDLADSPDEVVFRILVFKLFNKIETWELLEAALGRITFEEFNFRRYDDVLSRARREGQRIYSAAYIMPHNRNLGTSIKHQSHLALIERMMSDRLPSRLVDARGMQEGFALFRAYPSIGDFLAYQFITDVGYAAFADFGEMEFVMPGPGARAGLRKCFVDSGGRSEQDLIRMVTDVQEQEFERLGLTFQTLWGRSLQLIDCQNLFCEIDKYARVAYPHVGEQGGRTRIKQKFAPSNSPLSLFYPPKWNINDRIPKRFASGAWESDVDVRRGVPVQQVILARRSTEQMSLGTYQREALRTDQTSGQPGSVVVPMLGLAGEAGQLLSEYKKRLRDGETHRHFKDRVAEELGDLLWYVANVASKFGLELGEVAAANLAKVKARWSVATGHPLSFDAVVPENERLPRQFCVELYDVAEKARRRVRVTIEGVQVGDQLTDNAYDPDGYRFHDVFHFAYAAVLGWSPITRGLLRRKRKSCPEVDEVEDGGRAAVIEEGIVALVFDYARRHDMLRGIEALDYELLRTIKKMTTHLEVKRCTTGEWEHAIVRGFDVWRSVVEQLGGRVSVDLDRREIRYLGRVAEEQTVPPRV